MGQITPEMIRDSWEKIKSLGMVSLKKTKGDVKNICLKPIINKRKDVPDW